MAKDTIIEGVSKSKAWQYVALGSFVIGAILVGVAFNESRKAQKAEAEKKDAEKDKETAEGIQDAVASSVSGGSLSGREATQECQECSRGWKACKIRGLWVMFPC